MNRYEVPIESRGPTNHDTQSLPNMLNVIHMNWDEHRSDISYDPAEPMQHRNSVNTDDHRSIDTHAIRLDATRKAYTGDMHRLGISYDPADLKLFGDLVEEDRHKALSDPQAMVGRFRGRTLPPPVSATRMPVQFRRTARSDISTTLPCITSLDQETRWWKLAPLGPPTDHPLVAQISAQHDGVETVAVGARTKLVGGPRRPHREHVSYLPMQMTAMDCHRQELYDLRLVQSSQEQRAAELAVNSLLVPVDKIPEVNVLAKKTIPLQTTDIESDVVEEGNPGLPALAEPQVIYQISESAQRTSDEEAECIRECMRKALAITQRSTGHEIDAVERILSSMPKAKLLELQAIKHKGLSPRLVRRQKPVVKERQYPTFKGVNMPSPDLIEITPEAFHKARMGNTNTVNCEIGAPQAAEKLVRMNENTARKQAMAQARKTRTINVVEGRLEPQQVAKRQRPAGHDSQLDRALKIKKLTDSSTLRHDTPQERRLLPAAPMPQSKSSSASDVISYVDKMIV